MANGLYNLGKRQLKTIKILYVEGASITIEGLINRLGGDKHSIKRSLKSLEDKEIIIFLGGEEIKLTENGNQLFQMIESQDICIRKHDWDSVWRLVSYDIPVEFRKERDYLRNKLKEIGFLKVHDSLWVFPYESKEELAIFCHHLRISPFVIFMEANRLPNQSKYIKSFDLK